MVHEVSASVVGSNTLAAPALNSECGVLANRDRSVFDATKVHDKLTGTLRVLHLESMGSASAGGDFKEPGIAHLSAALGVKRSLAGDQCHALLFDRFGDECVAIPNGCNICIGWLWIVAAGIVASGNVQRGSQLLQDIRRGHAHTVGLGSAFAAPLPCAFHQLFIARNVNSEAAFFGHHLGEVNRETEGVMQAERILRRNALGRTRALGSFVEQRNAALECLTERNFFLTNGVHHFGGLLHQCWECLAERLNDRRNQLKHEWFARTQVLVTSANSAAQDATQDIVATFAARGRAISDRDGNASNMVGNHSIGDIGGAFQRSCVWLGTGDLCGEIKDWREQISVIVAALVLQHTHQSFQSHSGVHVARR